VQVESRSRFARFCAGNAANFSIWDEMGSLVIHEQLDAGKREQPGATNEGDQPVVVSDAIIEVIYEGVSTTLRLGPWRTH
jgi:hypothetical protein